MWGGVGARWPHCQDPPAPSPHVCAVPVLLLLFEQPKLHGTELWEYPRQLAGYCRQLAVD